MVGIENLLLALDRSRKRLVIAVGVAILLHMPLTPVMPVLRLARRVARHQTHQQAQVPQPPRQVEVELKEAIKSEEMRQEQAKVQPASNGPSLTVDPPTSVNSTRPRHRSLSRKKRSTSQIEKEKVKPIGLEGT